MVMREETIAPMLSCVKHCSLPTATTMVTRNIMWQELLSSVLVKVNYSVPIIVVFAVYKSLALITMLN